ncbi:MAG: DUF4390 domain-containing protein [Longimicrobiales bacterium]
MTVRAAFLALAALAGAAAQTAAQAPVAVRVEEGAPRVTVGDVLDDRALADAVRSGLPLRMRFRVELWRDTWFDDLVEQATWTSVLAYEPLERRFLAVGPGADSIGRFATYRDARVALERPYTPAVRPPREGSYYYLVYLEVETLSLSDLDELERWLRGELEPAVRGGRSITGAIGTGLKRLLVRVLGLPARRYEARSEPFRVP